MPYKRKAVRRRRPVVRRRRPSVRRRRNPRRRRTTALVVNPRRRKAVRRRRPARKRRVVRRRRPTVVMARPIGRRRVRRRKNAGWDFLTKALAGGAGFLASEKITDYIHSALAGNELLTKMGPWASVAVKGGLCYLLYKKGGKVLPLPIARAAAIGAGASAVKTVADVLMSGSFFGGGGSTAGLLNADLGQGVPYMGSLMASQPRGYLSGAPRSIASMGALDMSAKIF